MPRLSIPLRLRRALVVCGGVDLVAHEGGERFAQLAEAAAGLEHLGEEPPLLARRRARRLVRVDRLDDPPRRRVAREDVRHLRGGEAVDVEEHPAEGVRDGLGRRDGGAELGPADCPQVMPAALMSADQGAPTVPIAKGHAPLRVLRPSQPKSYRITFFVTIIIRHSYPHRASCQSASLGFQALCTVPCCRAGRSPA